MKNFIGWAQKIDFLGGPPSPQPHSIKAVATRGIVPNRLSAVSHRCMSQTRHFARDEITSLQILVSNWYLAGTTAITEEMAGGDMTVAASVSVDGETWVQATFYGQEYGVVVDGEDVLSDPCEIFIEDGQEFFVRLWKENLDGFIVFCEEQGNASAGDQFLHGNSPNVPDRTDGSPFTGNANSFTGGPTAILGATEKNSVLLIGDSIVYGIGDEYGTSSTGDLGKFAPGFGEAMGYIQAARRSDTAFNFLASHSRRTALEKYVTHVAGSYGRNDLTQGRTAQNIQDDTSAIAALFSTPVWWDTISPRSTSIDEWATVENQTVTGANPARATVNEWIRSNPKVFAGTFDTCQVIESDHAANDGRWAAGSITGDGVHPNASGYALIKNSSVIAIGDDYVAV